MPIHSRAIAMQLWDDGSETEGDNISVCYKDYDSDQHIAMEFENRKHVFKTTSDRILASREVKKLILDVNEIYKVNKDQQLMELMKRLTLIKRKIEKRLKGKPLAA